jgi:tRNA-2-methylthio-N6-dimethylallyladenosine synthase
MTDRFVDPELAGARFDRLRIVVERSALAANRARIGRTEEVLVEGPSKRDPSVVAARTPQHRLVHFPPPRPLRAGTYATVEITGAAPHHLTGQFRELVSEPAHKGGVRIPVSAL